MLQVCFLRPCSEEGSDATRHEVQIVTAVQMYHVRLWGSELGPLLFWKIRAAGTQS